MKEKSWAMRRLLFLLVPVVVLAPAGGVEVKNLVRKAEEARRAGDMITALDHYTEALHELRASDGNKKERAACEHQRDLLVNTLLRQLNEVQLTQARLFTLQKGIEKKMGAILKLDEDVQERMEDSQERLKDIESELLDAVR